jgi:predicted small lipoprotein YifL
MQKNLKSIVCLLAVVSFVGCASKGTHPDSKTAAVPVENVQGQKIMTADMAPESTQMAEAPQTLDEPATGKKGKKKKGKKKGAKKKRSQAAR